MCDEDWIDAAMSDDTVVVDLLLRLHQATPPTTTKIHPLSLHLDWSVRQPRSRSLPRLHHRCSPEAKDDADRASPTTPLSWSCATSASGAVAVGDGDGGDGCEESSCPIKLVDSSRSTKVCCFLSCMCFGLYDFSVFFKACCFLFCISFRLISPFCSAFLDFGDGSISGHRRRFGFCELVSLSEM